MEPEKTCKYAFRRVKWATGEEMKVSLVIVLALIVAATAATALAYGQSAVTASVTAVAAQAATGPTEPGFMLLSGSALLGLAGALKRFTF